MVDKTRKTKIMVSCMTLIFVSFIVYVLPRVANYTDEVIGSFDAPDSSFYYTSDELYHTADLYGEDGRRIYILMRWTFDVVWPLAYTGFLMSWIYFLTEKSKFKRLYLIPLIAMSFDFLENIGATIVFYNYPIRTHLIAWMTPWFSLLKWTTLSLTFLLWFCIILFQSIKTVMKLITK